MIFVDADACPVKKEVIRVAERYRLSVTLVANRGLRPTREPHVRNVVVSDGFDAADDWIVEASMKGDVVVTADVPLAKRLVSDQIFVLAPNGKEFSEDAIGMQSAVRDLNQMLRESGEISGYNSPFSNRDRSNFLQGFDRIVRRAIQFRADK